jgi:hypothetical protein
MSKKWEDYIRINLREVIVRNGGRWTFQVSVYWWALVFTVLKLRFWCQC